MADSEDKQEYEVEDGVILDSADNKIEVVDDTPDIDKNRTPLKEPPAEVTDEELSRYADSKKIHNRLKQLNTGIHDERRAKELATRERDEAVRVAQAIVEENKQLQGSLASNTNILLEQTKKNVQVDIEEAKRAFREAQEAFDTEGIIEAQQKLTAAVIRADKVNNFQPAPIQPVKNVVQTPQQPTLDARTQAWNDKNSWFTSNRKMRDYALNVHEELKESGEIVGSEHYFAVLDADIQNRFPEAFNGARAEAKSSQRQQNNVVASAARSTAAKKVVLTQTQVNIAKRLGVPLELYARKVAEEMRKI